MTFEMKIEFSDAQLQKLLRIPVMLRLGPAERTLKAMAKPVADRGKAIAPQSRKSAGTAGPSRDKMSKKTKAKWPEEGRKHIGFVYRKTDAGGYIVIGGKAPLANSFNFDASNKGRKVMYWGKASGRIKRVAPKDRFMQRALDETKAAQESAGFAQLEKELKELNLG